MRGYVISLALCVLAVPFARSQDQCKVFFDASDKLMTVAHHSYMSRAEGKGTAKVSESILVDGASYVELQGKWVKSLMNPQAMHEQELENRKNNKVSCQRVRDEAVNGEPATVFTMHAESEDTQEDATVWISKKTNLLLRQEISLGPEEHISIRYEYTNITAPKISP
jgi:hypothetical protein